MPDSSKDECSQLAELIRMRTKTLRIRDRRTQAEVLTVTVSGGISAMQAGGDRPTLTARADAALYQSTQSGRDRPLPARACAGHRAGL